MKFITLVLLFLASFAITNERRRLKSRRFKPGIVIKADNEKRILELDTIDQVLTYKAKNTEDSNDSDANQKAIDAMAKILNSKIPPCLSGKKKAFKEFLFYIRDYIAGTQNSFISSLITALEKECGIDSRIFTYKNEEEFNEIAKKNKIESIEIPSEKPDCSSVEEELRQAKDKNEELARKLKKAEEDLQQKKKENEELAGELKKAEEDLQQKKKENEELAEELKQKEKDFDGKIKELQETIEGLKKELKDKENCCSDLKKAKEEIENLKEELNKANDEIKKLQVPNEKDCSKEIEDATKPLKEEIENLKFLLEECLGNKEKKPDMDLEKKKMKTLSNIFNGKLYLYDNSKQQGEYYLDAISYVGKSDCGVFFSLSDGKTLPIEKLTWIISYTYNDKIGYCTKGASHGPQVDKNFIRKEGLHHEGGFHFIDSNKNKNNDSYKHGEIVIDLLKDTPRTRKTLENIYKGFGYTSNDKKVIDEYINNSLERAKRNYQ